MGLWSSFKTGVKGLVGGFGGFFAGSAGWGLVSGFANGMLETVGLALPSLALMALGPIVGVITAGVVLAKVMG